MFVLAASIEVVNVTCADAATDGLYVRWARLAAVNVLLALACVANVLEVARDAAGVRRCVDPTVTIGSLVRVRVIRTGITSFRQG